MQENLKKVGTGVWIKLKEKKVWIPILLLVCGYGIFKFFGGNSDVNVFTYKVEPKEFIQKVSLTGKVIAAKNVDMAFEVSGRVNNVRVKVGDIVKKGDVLASISNGDYAAAVQKNVAITASEQAKLNDLLYGTKKENIQNAEDSVSSAEENLKISEQTFLDQIYDTYGKIDEAIRFNIDTSFTDPRSINPLFKYSIDQNPQLGQSLNAQRIQIGEVLKNMNAINSISQIALYRSQISQIQKFINDANLAISIVADTNRNSSDAAYIATIAAEKVSIALARNMFSASLSALNQAEAAYKASVNALVSAKNARTLVLSSATPEQVSIYKANIASAAASVGSAQAQLSRTLIRAPFAGVITKVDIKEGEISSPNTPVISMLNDGEYQIETFVSENDISKLKINQPAKITLDAYGRDVFFSAVVISVDPAETVKDGVSTYRTKIQFVGKDEKVKSGMTANIEIETDKRVGVLQIPQVAVILDAGVKKTYILNDITCVGTGTATSTNCAALWEKKESVTLTPIQTGEISATGDIEILSGITNGQTIIYSIKAQ